MNVRIVDTTLRDGEQMAGLVFSPAEKLAIAQLLDRAGVHAIEAGVPAMGGVETEAFRLILEANLKAEVVAWNRAIKADVDSAVACGFQSVHISLAVSDFHIEYKLRKSREWVLDRIGKCVRYARSFGCRVMVGAEDASRADPKFFLQYAKVAADAGAERIRFADTVGCLDPFTVNCVMEAIIPQCPIPIEFHGHNDFGLAVANTIAATHAGVGLVSVTVGGIGERAGNADMGTVISALEDLYGLSTGIKRTVVPDLLQAVQSACGFSQLKRGEGILEK